MKSWRQENSHLKKIKEEMKKLELKHATFREIRNRKEFTIPELMHKTGVSTLVTWRTVQKLIKKGLVRPTGKVKPAEAGRGKPSVVYKYVGEES